jgi:hypothetical protein
MNLRRGITTTTKGEKCNDRYITNPPANPSLMPTPWSARAEAMKYNDACDRITQKQSRDNDAHAGHFPRGHFPTQGMSSREGISTSASYPNPTVAANKVIKSGNEKELEILAATKLELTAIKGQWADKDSDDE